MIGSDVSKLERPQTTSVLGHASVHWACLVCCVDSRLLDEISIDWQSQGIGKSVGPVTLFSNFIEKSKSCNNSDDPKQQGVICPCGCRKLRDSGRSVDKAENVQVDSNADCRIETGSESELEDGTSWVGCPFHDFRGTREYQVVRSAEFIRVRPG